MNAHARRSPASILWLIPRHTVDDQARLDVGAGPVPDLFPARQHIDPLQSWPPLQACIEVRPDPRPGPRPLWAEGVFPKSDHAGILRCADVSWTCGLGGRMSIPAFN